MSIWHYRLPLRYQLMPTDAAATSSGGVRTGDDVVERVALDRLAPGARGSAGGSAEVVIASGVRAPAMW